MCTTTNVQQSTLNVQFTHQNVMEFNEFGHFTMSDLPLTYIPQISNLPLMYIPQPKM